MSERVLVPSARQVELGLDDEFVASADDRRHAAQIESESEARRPIGVAVREFVVQMDPRKATAGHPARPVAVFALNGALQGVAAATLGANFARIIDDLGVSDKSIILLGAVLQLVGAILGPLLGHLSDRIRRLTLATVGAIGFGITAMALGLFPSIFFFFLARIAQSVFGLAWGNVTTLPLMGDYYPPEVRGRVFAVPQTIGSMGGVVGPLIGGALGQWLGWHTAVLITAIPASFTFIGFLTLKEPSRGYWDRVRMGVDESTATVRPKPPSFAESWRAAKSIRTLRRYWMAEIFQGLGGTLLIPLFLVIARNSAGGSPLVLGMIIAASAISTTAGIAVGGTLVDILVTDHRPGRVLVAQGWVQIFNVVGLTILVLVHNLFVLLPIILIQPFANGLVVTSRDVLTSQVIPARLRSFGLQISPLFGLLALVALPFVLVLAPGNPIQALLVAVVPLMTVGALILMTASVDVEHDIAAARAAAVAEQEMASSRRDGTGAKLLVCRDVDVHYDGVQVLFGVDFDAEEGELIALLGTNGAGKSTLLRAISGVSEASGGAIFLDGRDVTHAPAHELARFGVVQMPGGKGVFPALSVEDNLRAATWLDPDDVEARLERVFELFPALAGRRRQLAGSLSGGEQQMVALGQAFLMKPKLLLIDELSLGLAPTIVEVLLQAVEAIHRAGTTVILVEQSVNLALTVADRAVFMEKGAVRFSGPTAELLDRPDILRSVYLRGSADGGSGTSAGPAARRGKSSVAATSLALEVRDIAVSYGGVQALRQASLSVGPGEIVGLIGPNGAGKTTLFDVISGFVSPDAGSVTIAGKDSTLLPPEQRAHLGLARSFQDGRLFPSLTVVENIAMAVQRHLTGAESPALNALWLPKARQAERRLLRRAEELIVTLGLRDFRDKFASELSTGSRRIVDLACMMAAEPELLLLDEPSSGIAQAEAEELAPVLDRLRRDLGCGLLIIEHDMKLLTTVADRMVGMVLGETIVSGSVDDVTSDPTMVAAYLGTSTRVLARSGALADDISAPEPRTPRSQP
jgi:branched-chain amino acid transport system ATP-binding protein